METQKILSDFLAKIKPIFSGADYDDIEHAVNYAAFKHAGQIRSGSGEPYIVHPLAVAEILLDFGLDSHTIVAAILHDVLEDTDTKQADIKSAFGTEVAELVNGVSRVKTLKYKSSEQENTESLRKMFIAMAKDIRVIMIKLADRLHNMRTIDNMSPEHQVRKSMDTRDVYIPIAERLGLGSIKGELEDICFKYLHPKEYAEISSMLEHRLERHQKSLEIVNGELKAMIDRLGIVGDVKSRIKRKYSVYKKSIAKGIDSIYDLLAHRVLVESVKDCYYVLGEIHNLWKPVPGRIKDYIAAPKRNGYQSLHTTLLMEDGMPFEVQIRTKEMHRVCEFGIAAHWKYKNGVQKSSDLDQKLSFLRQILEESKDITDAKTFLSVAKTDFYTNEIFVFTPKNKVIQLTENSTPIDFAYAIHSDLGNKCTGARVNGRMVGLTTKLKTGDIVEIITSPNSKGPSRDWLKLAKTPSARTKIKQFFKREMKEENIHLGREMLEMEAKRKNLTLAELLTNDAAVEKLLARQNFLDTDDLFASVGYGGVTASFVITHLVSEIEAREKAEEKHSRGITAGVKTSKTGVRVLGVDDIYIRLAGCCNPIPSDDIIGFVTQGNGIAVHRTDCPNVRKINGERLVKVAWDAGESSHYTATIVMIVEDRHMIVNNITFVLGSIPNISLTGLNAQTTKGTAQVTITVQVTSMSQITEIINKLGAIDGVKSVYRR